MARTTGKPAVFFATSGPGATNTLTAIADAKLDSVPIICITGQVPRNMIGTDAFQEVDIYGMSIPVTKHNFLVRGVDELLRVIPEAFRIAASGRPGPVLIDIPKDVQTARIEIETLPEPGAADPVEAPDHEGLTQAARMLAESKRPIFMLGGGVAASGAAASARALAEAASLPAVMTLLGLGILPDAHPLNLGLLGMPAFSSAFCEAPKHRSTQVSPFSATRRSRMPVRVTIHSSLVSTMRSRSALVSRVSGTQWPIPRMMQEVFIGTLVWWVWTGGAGGLVRRGLKRRAPWSLQGPCAC